MEDITVNDFIPRFGEFIVSCRESDISKDKALEIMYEFINNPIKYNSVIIIKDYLIQNLEIDSYIQLTNKLNF